MPVKEKEEKRVKIGAEIPAPTYKQLEDVARWYRTNGNLSHALRLLIEDAWKGIQQGDPASRFRPSLGVYHREGETGEEEVTE